ncbi:MAG TPA: hypothetical protein PL051_03145 [Candidatus Saccharibacteria bacterium]|nr:hypothetical protein [Candidatus Saccharibacteria bacterium]
MTGRTYEDIPIRDGVPPDYRPTPYSKLVRIISSDTGLEHIHILPIPEELAFPGDGRLVEVTSDTTIALNELSAQLHGDGMFLFNALVQAVRVGKTAAQLRRFGSGNLPEDVSRVTLNSRFMRTIQALDAWAMKASDVPLVQRSSWNSGAGVEYALMGDVAVVDRRK